MITNIVEFAENVMNLKLLDFQKKYLTEMYDIYKKDPDSFNKLTYPCRRGSVKFDAMPLFAVIFSMFNEIYVLDKIRAEKGLTESEEKDGKKNTIL